MSVVLYLDCFAMLIMTKLVTYNDETRNSVIARRLLSEVEVHEAIQIEQYSSGLLRSARNDGDLYRHHSFLLGIFSMPATRNDGDLYRHHSFLQGIFPMLATRNDGDLYRHHSFLQGNYPMLDATNDESCKLVNFSVFEKRIFSLRSRNDVRQILVTITLFYVLNIS